MAWNPQKFPMVMLVRMELKWTSGDFFQHFTFFYLNQTLHILIAHWHYFALTSDGLEPTKGLNGDASPHGVV